MHLKYNWVTFEEEPINENKSAETQWKKNLEELLNCGWYFRNCNGIFYDSEISSDLLKKTVPGTFLIRDSSSPRYLFTLSVQTQRGPTNVRLVCVGGKFSLDAADAKHNHTLPAFSTVLQLVQYYVSQFYQNHHLKQVWIDSLTGRTHSEVSLQSPLRKEAASLKHLCRLAINKNSLPTKSLPPSIQQYLTHYPYLF